MTYLRTIPLDKTGIDHRFRHLSTSGKLCHKVCIIAPWCCHRNQVDTWLRSPKKNSRKRKESRNWCRNLLCLCRFCTLISTARISFLRSWRSHPHKMSHISWTYQDLNIWPLHLLCVCSYVCQSHLHINKNNNWNAVTLYGIVLCKLKVPDVRARGC